MIDKKEVGYCRRCGRKLKKQESKQAGFGNVCLKKYLAENSKAPLFLIKIKEGK